jgi:hypothetical protein
VLAHAGTPDEQVALFLVVAGLWLGWAGLSRLRGKGFPRLPLASAWVLSGLGAVIMVAGLILPRQFMRPNAASATPVGARPSSTAALTIRQPTEGEDIRGAHVEVVMELTGGRVIDTATTTITPDTGHIHLSLDGKVVSMTYGVVQLVDLMGIAPGSHTLRAEFVAADHGPFDPRVIAIVRFTTGGAT